MTSRGRRRSILKPPNSNEPEPEDNGGYTEKLDTQTIFFARKRVSFSHRHEVKEFQNVSVEDRSNSICVEPSIMDITMQHTNVDDSIESENGGGAGVANMSMTYLIPNGERGDKTFIENTDQSGKNMCMTFTMEQPRVINVQQNRYRDVTFAVGDLLNKDNNFDMSFTRAVLDSSPVEDQLQQQVINNNNNNNTRIEQHQQHYPSPDMSLTMSEDSPLQQENQNIIPSSSSGNHNVTANYENDNNNENDASLLSHHTNNNNNNNNQVVTNVQQQQYQPAESMMMETTNFENDDDDVFLPNPVHNQRNETCFEFATLPQNNMSRTEIWESSKYHQHQPPVNFDQTKADFANMSIEPSQFSKTINVKIPKSYNQTLGNFENFNMSMTINEEVRDINKTKVNMNFEQTGLPFNPNNMSMTVNEEGYNFNTTTNYTSVNNKDKFEKTSANNHLDMSVTNFELNCAPNLNETKINLAPYQFEETRLDKNGDMSITIHPEATNAVNTRYTSPEDNFEETKLNQLDMSVTMNEASRFNNTKYDDRPILNLEQTRPEYLDMSVTMNEPLNKTRNMNILPHTNFNSTRNYYNPDMSVTVNYMNESSDENKMCSQTQALKKDYNSNNNDPHPIVQNQIFQQTEIENLDMSETRFEEEEEKEEDPTPIKKMTKSKSGHHKTNINKNLEKTTIGNANMSITTNIPSSSSLQFNNVQKRVNLEQTQFFPNVSMTMDLDKSKIPSQRQRRQRQQQQHHRTIIQPPEQEYSDMSMTMGALTVSSQQSQPQKIKMPFTEPVVENRNPMMTMMASNKSGNNMTNNKNNNNNDNRSEPDNNKRKTYIVVQNNEIIDKAIKMPPPTSSTPISSTTKSRLPNKSDNRRSKIAVPDNSAFGRFGSSKTPRRKLPSDLFSAGVPPPSSNNRTPPTPTKIPVPINSPVKKKSSSSSLSSLLVKDKQGTFLSNVNKGEGKKNNNMVSLKTNLSPSLELLPPTFHPTSNETNFKAKKRILMSKETIQKEGSKADNDVKSPNAIHQNKKIVDSNNKFIHNLITTTTTTTKSTPPQTFLNIVNNINNNNKDDKKDDNNLEEYSTLLKTTSSDKNLGILVEPDLVPETVRSSTIFTNSPGYNNITLSATNNNYQQKSNDVTMASIIIGPIIPTTPTIFSPKTIERSIISASPLQLEDVSYSRDVNVSDLDDTFSVSPRPPLPSQNQPQYEQQQLFVPDSPQIIVPVQSIKVRELNKIEDPNKQRKEMYHIPPIVNNIQNPKSTTFTSTTLGKENNNCNSDKVTNNSKVPLKDKIDQLKLLKGLRLQTALSSFSENLQVLDDSSFDLVIKEITGFVNPNFIQTEQKIREYNKFMNVLEYPTEHSDLNGLLAFSKRKLAEIP